MRKKVLAVFLCLTFVVATLLAFGACDNAKMKADLTSTTLTVKKIDTQTAYYATVEAEKFSQAAGIELSAMNTEAFIRTCLDHGFIDFDALGIEEMTDVGFFKSAIENKIPDVNDFEKVVVSDKETKKVTYMDKTYDYDISETEADWCTLYVYTEGSEHTAENRIGTIRCISYSADDKGYFIGEPEIAIEPLYVENEKVINEMPFVFKIDIPLNLPNAGEESYSFEIAYTLYWQIAEKSN